MNKSSAYQNVNSPELINAWYASGKCLSVFFDAITNNVNPGN